MNKGSFFYLKIQIFILHLLLFFPGPVYSITLTMKEIVLVDTQITLGTFISVKDSSYSLKKQIEGCTLTLEQDRILCQGAGQPVHASICHYYRQNNRIITIESFEELE